jgi:hypothetical protein
VCCGQHAAKCGVAGCVMDCQEQLGLTAFSHVFLQVQVCAVLAVVVWGAGVWGCWGVGCGSEGSQSQ